MEWKSCYLDVVLVPLGFLITVAYHVWLLHKIKTQPLTTVWGTNAYGRRLWVSAIMKDNDKKNIIAVQTIRNMIMVSTLMATTAILLSSGLAAVISSTYSVKKPIGNSVIGAHGEFMVSIKYVTLLFIFLFSFISHALSVKFVNQVNFLINSPVDPASLNSVIGPEYVTELMEKAFLLGMVGNRIFYAGVPFLLWIFGPVVAFLCSTCMVSILYNLDKVEYKNGVKGKVDSIRTSGEFDV